MALDRDADELRLVRRLHLANGLLPFTLGGPFVTPSVELVDVDTLSSQVPQRLVQAIEHILLRERTSERSTRLHRPYAVFGRNFAGDDHVRRLATALADQALTVAIAVDQRGVVEVDTGIPCGAQ